MNGKDYVLEACEKVAEIISKLEQDGDGDDHYPLDALKQGREHLLSLKNKATLRTKTGANLAFPVLDSANALSEAVDDDDEAHVVTSAMESFVDNVEVLSAALKERTVIMT